VVNFDDEIDDNEDDDEEDEDEPIVDAHSFVMTLLGGQQILDPGNLGRDAVWHQTGLR